MVSLYIRGTNIPEIIPQPGAATLVGRTLLLNAGRLRNEGAGLFFERNLTTCNVSRFENCPNPPTRETMLFIFSPVNRGHGSREPRMTPGLILTKCNSSFLMAYKVRFRSGVKCTMDPIYEDFLESGDEPINRIVVRETENGSMISV